MTYDQGARVRVHDPAGDTGLHDELGTVRDCGGRLAIVDVDDRPGPPWALEHHYLRATT